MRFWCNKNKFSFRCVGCFQIQVKISNKWLDVLDQPSGEMSKLQKETDCQCTSGIGTQSG